MGGNKAGRRHSDRLKRIRKDNKRIAAKLGDEADDVAGPTADTPIAPLASRLCELLHGEPSRRRADCCRGAPASAMVAECARVLEVLDVAAVEQIEHAVGEHDRLAGIPPCGERAPRRLGQREGVHPRPSVSAARSCSALQAAVPTSRITTPAAWFASAQALG